MTINLDRSHARNLPHADLITVKAVRDALAGWQKADHAAKSAEQDATALEQERPLAVQRDREALADALESGKPDPGQQHTDAHDHSVEEAQRAAAALTLLEERRFEDLRVAFVEHSDELVANAQKKLDAARTEYIEAVERAAGAAWHTARR